MSKENWTDAELKADLAAERARAKALRPWYQKKRYMIPLGLLVLGMFGSLAGGDEEEDASTATTDTTAAVTTEATEAAGPEATTGPKAATTTRVDAQDEDHEATIGGPGVRFSGYTTTVAAASFRQSVSDFEDDGYVVADVTIVNRDDKTQPFSIADWKLQTPGGQVLDVTFTSVDQLEAFGNLVQGGTVSGKVVWKVGAEKGPFVIIYKPDPFDAARGIWPLTL